MQFGCRRLVVGAVLLAAVRAVFGQADPAYRVVKKVAVGGKGGWD